MFKTTRTIMKSFLFALLLACIVTLPLDFTGVSSALATTKPHPHAKHPHQFVYTSTCLSEAAGISYDGPNEILLSGSTYSTCGGPGVVTNVNQKMLVTNGCEGSYGTGPSTLYDEFEISWQDTDTAYYTDQVGCVVCHYTNHHLTGETYPNFIMFLTVSATGNVTA